MLNMEYYARWKANNNTGPMEDLTDTNKNRLIRDVRSIANGNRYDGNTCEWWVWDSDNYILAAGGTNSNGYQWRLHDQDLADFAQEEWLLIKK